ncbi:MAG: acyl carrier protein [Chloroflexi bacterium]|nr:acyl carrier protein [Chloroflexota bacterium]MCI0578241.1 acyl carrier protein [Chloroflexota bacterium]MCI0649679.1 acyl carrier protein [Chloroflexota bacterium]
MDRDTRTHLEEAIQEWLINRVSAWLVIDPEDIDIQEPFASYGLTSITAVSLTGDLEDWLGIELAPTLAYEYPTIAALASHLTGELARLQKARTAVS